MPTSLFNLTSEAHPRIGVPIVGSRSFKLLTTSHSIFTHFSRNYQCYLSSKYILMSLGNSVNKLNFDPILIKLSLNFNSNFIKLSPNFDSFFIELSLNWYKIVSQIWQNCHSSCITLLLIPLLWVSVDVIMVYRTIHFPHGEGGGVSNTTATWVWALKGVWSTNTTWAQESV